MESVALVNIIVYISIAIGMGLLPAVIARGKGRSFVRWWIYGAVLFPAALAHILFMGFLSERIECPYCRNSAGANDHFCKRCGYEFVKSE